MRRQLAAASIALVALSASSFQMPAQSTPDRSRWSIEQIHGPTLPFEMTLDEGTNISLDVSPDGRTVVFDLLGDLYSVPIAGGAATRLTAGPAFDRQPRFSPDGRRIAFVSDRSGTDNVWLADADGSHPKALTSEKDALFASPIWTFDGRYVLARNQGIVALPVSGDSAFKFQGSSGPAPSPEGRWIYYHVRNFGSAWQVHRYDRETGASVQVTGGPGGGVRPLVSPDGRYLAYSKRVDVKQLLVLRDLRTGAERVVFDGLDPDEQETWIIDGDVMPGYAFTPDASAIVIAVGGKIRRIDLARGAAAVIPFSARVQMTLTEKVYIQRRIEDGERAALRMLRWMHLTPDGKQLVFGAAGKIFSYDLTSRRAVPIVDGPGLEYSPAVSPDGRWIAYVAWSDESGGHVYKAPIDGGAPVRLTAAPGLFQHLAWSPDGRRLVLLQAYRGLQSTETVFSDVRWIDARQEGQTHLVATLPPRAVRRQAVRPRFDSSGERVYFAEGADVMVATRYTDLVSAKLDGTDKRRHLRFAWGADDIVPSPDGRWVAFTQGHDVYLTAMAPAATDPIVEVKVEALTRVSGDGGGYVAWADGGRTLTWSWGATFYRSRIGPDSGRAHTSPSEISVAVDLPRPRPPGTILLRGARIITMTDQGVIERGDLLVERNRVKAVGRSGTLDVPAGAAVIDVAGKTIVPGFVDVHNHYEYRDDFEVFPERNWRLLVNLAYGITTVRDPSSRSAQIFTLAEMVETGATLGPRIFSTGDIVGTVGGPNVCCPRVNSLEEARRQVRRLKALGATSIKQYALPQREQQQWVVQAAREEGLVVTTHTLGRTESQLATVMDGHTGLEHAISPARIYKDVLAVLARTGTYYAPTIINDWLDTYFHQATDTHGDPKLRRFTPHAILDDRRVRRPTVMPNDEYPFWVRVRAAADIVRAGGHVAMGSHLNREGLGAHWEIWGFVMGGMPPLDALRAATRTGAESLGLQQDIGSLAPGMMADLIVLDANPLDDIRNTEKIRFVMKNGVLRAGDTLDEVWPSQRPLGPFSWEREQY